MTVIALLSAPSNLGLRPPQVGSVPGCAKAPEAYREAGLHRRFVAAGAEDSGVVVPARYVADRGLVSGQASNQDALVDYSRRLGQRVGRLLDADRAPLVLGGDCSLLVGIGLCLARRGRYGLVHIDGHTDFRHPGSGVCRSVAGEDLAAAVGWHWPALADIDGCGPYFDPDAVVHIGCRDTDAGLAELGHVIATVSPASDVIEQGPDAVAARAQAVVGVDQLDGFWLHIDVDVLDPSQLPAVDSPDSGGLTCRQLHQLLSRLAPSALGAAVTIFDPDLDPAGVHAARLTELLCTSLAHLGTEIR